MLSHFLPVLLLMQAILRTQSLDTWPQNFVLARPDTAVNLRCKSDDQHIMRENEIDKSQPISIEPLDFQVVAQMDAGKYVCMVDGKMVDSIHLFIDYSEHYDDTCISCTADSYLQGLKCSWTQYHTETPDKVRVKAERSQSHEAPWIDTIMENESTAKFELQIPPSCLYGEEAESFTVYLEAIDNLTYVSVNRTMFIRDIIKPGRPENLTFKMEGQEAQVDWKYPSSWAMPHSYFPLLFQLELHFENNSKDYITVEGERWKTGDEAVKAVRLRCRDLFYNSSWSDWTEIVVNPKRRG